MAGTEWEPYRQEIERLFCHENNTLDAVMAHMASNYAWQKSKGQYQRQLKKWGLRKNGPHIPHWTFIGRRMQKRKLYQQKESEVYLDGAQIPAKRLKKAMYREAHVKMEDLVPSAPSPATPDGVMVCTPVSPGMHVEWNMELPWLRFLNRINPGSPGSASPSASPSVASPGKLSVSSRSFNQALMDRILRIVPWNKLCQPPNIYSCSRIATVLTIVMPEASEDQHDTLSSGLCHSNIVDKDRFHLELFLLSNNHMPDISLAWGTTVEMYENMDLDSEHAIEIFNGSDWNSCQRLRLLLSTQEPTVEAIAERVFTSAVRLFDLKTVRIMLEAGMDSGIAVETVHSGPLTPLQYASMYELEGLDLLALLLHHKADVNLFHNELPALGYAVEEGNNDAITLLLEAGSKVTQSCLYPAAFARINYRQLETLISACPDVNAPAELQGRSLLAEAVYQGNVDMVRLLLARGADVGELFPIDIDGGPAVTSVLGYVSYCSRINMFQALLPACGIINPEYDDLPVISPLTLAVERGKAEIARILIEEGVNIETADDEGSMTLLERAANLPTVYKDKIPLCRLLISAGARVNRPSSNMGCGSSALLNAVKEGSFEVADLLISAGARLNDIYSQPPGTVLGAAIEQGNPTLIDWLILANSRVANGKIRCIGNLSTAHRLEQYGILQTILETSGNAILKKALFDSKHDLVQYLLNRGVDTLLRSQGQVNSTYEITAVGAAVMTHNLAAAKILLSRGAKVNDEDLACVVRANNGELLRTVLVGFRGNGATAVAFAIKRKQLLGIILAAGVDITGTPQWRSTGWIRGRALTQAVPNSPKSVLEVAVAYKVGDDELKTLLGSADWDPKLTGRALVIAALMGNNELAHRLIEYGADVNQETGFPLWRYTGGTRPPYGAFTPLQAAVKSQMVSLVKALVQFADVNYLGHGRRRRTPLQHAVEQGNMEIINTLLDHGAKVDSPPASDGGATALQIAAIKGYIGIAQLLISLGADVNEPPARYNGSTALEGAAQHGRIDLLQLLLNKGALVVGDGEKQYEKAVELTQRHGHMSAARLLKAFRDSVEVNTPGTAPKLKGLWGG